jgi:uncharacterized protein YndB with AHSA1/START domain
MTATEASVRKSVTVKASVERAFQVFTEGWDTWWPKSHNIGKSPLKKSIIEGFVGGRCYGELEDGSDCPWGEIVAWEPPHRLVMAWKISPQWQYEPDVAKSSEVEVRFTPEPDGSTRVDLEHRHFERMGEGWENIRQQVDSDKMGWSDLLAMYAAQVGR